MKKKYFIFTFLFVAQSAYSGKVFILGPQENSEISERCSKGMCSGMKATKTACPYEKALEIMEDEVMENEPDSPRFGSCQTPRFASCSDSYTDSWDSQIAPKSIKGFLEDLYSKIEDEGSDHQPCSDSDYPLKKSFQGFLKNRQKPIFDEESFGEDFFEEGSDRTSGYRSSCSDQNYPLKKSFQGFVQNQQKPIFDEQSFGEDFFEDGSDRTSGYRSSCSDQNYPLKKSVQGLLDFIFQNQYPYFSDGSDYPSSNSDKKSIYTFWKD